MEGEEDRPAIAVIIGREGQFGRPDVFALRLPNVRRHPKGAAIALKSDALVWRWERSDSLLCVTESVRMA